MKTIWVITKKELATYFDSLIAYVLITLFLGFSGFFTWLYGTDIFLIGQADLRPFFNVAYWTLFFFIPALTMRSVSEEKSSGTIELLLTKPVTDWQLIVGKYFANLIVIFIALVLTAPYVITVASIGNLDTGATLLGYTGLLFMSSAYIGIGIYASSITKNQIVSFLIALFIGLFFHIIFSVFANNMSGSLAEMFSYLDMSTHFNSMSRGVLDTKDVLYFLSLTFLGLYFSVLTLSKRNLN
jgi:ABC-2 type transport system permease protein